MIDIGINFSQPGTVGMSTWMYSCDETPNDDHLRNSAPSAKAHQSSAHKNKCSGSHQSPFPVWTQWFSLLSSLSLSLSQVNSNL